MPDRGPVLLLTRPAVAAARFLAALRAAGADNRAIISPLIEVEFLAADLPKEPFSALILTSENGAAATTRLGLPASTRAYCVGDQTSRAARRAGLDPISAGGDADTLVRLILARKVGGPLLHLRGEHARGDIVARLSAHGVAARDLIVYRQHGLVPTPEARNALDGTQDVVAPLFSPRTVSILAETGPIRAPLTVIAISAAVAEAAEVLSPRRIIVAEMPDGSAMQNATIAALRGGPVLETWQPDL